MELDKKENLEKIKKISKKVSNLSTLNREYIIEGQNSLQNFFEEEFVTMNEANYVVNQFKKKVRESLHNLHIDFYRKYIRQQDREFVSDELVQNEEYDYDEYGFLENRITVLNFKITIENDLLYDLLNSLEQKHRDIIYLSFCENWSDMQIGTKLDMSRQKVKRIKQKIRNEIYNTLKGKVEECDKN